MGGEDKEASRIRAEETRETGSGGAGWPGGARRRRPQCAPSLAHSPSLPVPACRGHPSCEGVILTPHRDWDPLWDSVPRDTLCECDHEPLEPTLGLSRSLSPTTASYFPHPRRWHKLASLQPNCISLSGTFTSNSSALQRDLFFFGQILSQTLCVT